LKIHRVTCLTASVAFILMLLTSIILFIVSQGRVAYWPGWRLWGLTKTDWGNIHINLGLLLLIALFLHIYYNWKLVVRELKRRGIEAYEELTLKNDDFRGRHPLINELANQRIGLFSFTANHQSP